MKLTGDIIVFHGTTDTHAAGMLADGCDAGMCVTTSEDLAWYYAECAAEDEDGGEDSPGEAVVQLTVSVADLDPDMEAMAEPVGHGGRTGSQIDDLLTDTGDDRTSLTSSLQICASARLRRPVAAAEVTLIS